MWETLNRAGGDGERTTLEMIHKILVEIISKGEIKLEIHVRCICISNFTEKEVFSWLMDLLILLCCLFFTCIF